MMKVMMAMMARRTRKKSKGKKAHLRTPRLPNKHQQYSPQRQNPPPHDTTPPLRKTHHTLLPSKCSFYVNLTLAAREEGKGKDEGVDEGRAERAKAEVSGLKGQNACQKFDGPIPDRKEGGKPRAASSLLRVSSSTGKRPMLRQARVLCACMASM